MKIRIILISLIIALVLAFAACSFGSEKETGDTQAGETSGEEITEDETGEAQTWWQTTNYSINVDGFTTTAPSVSETSGEAATIPSATKPATTKPATTKPVTTWSSTTRAPATWSTTTTTRPTTRVNYEGQTRVQSETETVQLKYGVSRTVTKDVIYAVNADGSVTAIGSQNEETTYNRLNYSAGYSDLLPAAKEHMQTYKAFINEVLSRTNRMRAEKGLPALKLTDKLTEQANVRAEEIAWSGKHSHARPSSLIDIKYFSSIFKENGLTSGTAGENIGWGYNTPADVCTAWRNSETHYENIISSDYKSIGIGVAPDCDPAKGLCWVQHFYSE